MILVTGGTGLLGSHLLFELSNQDRLIRATYRYENTKDEVFKIFQYYDNTSALNRWKKIEWIKADVRDVISLHNCFDGVEFVYHCAGLVSFDSKDFNRCLKTNKEGTANIVNMCLKKGVKKLCHVSSTAAVGETKFQKTTEENKWENKSTTSAYSVSKYLAEMEVWRGVEEGLNAVIINPCLIFGPGKWEETSLTIFKNIEKGMRFYTIGSNAVVDARDVSSCMHKLMNSKESAQRFLCIGENVSFKELQKKIAVCLNKKPPSVFVPKWISISTSYVLMFFSRLLRFSVALTPDTIHSAYKTNSYDNSKIIKAIGVHFYSLDQTIENTINGRLVKK